MPGIRDLKTRIKANQNMRKVTRAMQMVSAAKMRKAQAAVLASRTYSALVQELIQKLAPKLPAADPLLVSYPNAPKIGVVVLGSNRGLVGGLNSNLGQEMQKLASQPGTTLEAIVYGRQAKNVTLRLHKHVLADFPKIETTITTENIYPLAQYLTQAYKSGEYRSIVIVYNHFVSTLAQKPSTKQLLPFTEDLPANSAAPKKPAPTEDDPGEEIDTEYIFEPSPKSVLEHLLPRVIESQLYQAILESDASEHSARMVMMKNATEAAGDLINHLTLTYNQLRQGKITTELAEITAGRIALE